jgi:hypothetical protein
MEAKEEGNKAYKAKQYRESIKHYSEAIRKTDPTLLSPPPHHRIHRPSTPLCVFLP